MIALDRSAATRAIAISVCVGTLLLLINHGDHLLQEPVCRHFYLKAALSYVIPLVVSLVSSAAAVRRVV